MCYILYIKILYLVDSTLHLIIIINININTNNNLNKMYSSRFQLQAITLPIYAGD